MIRLPWLRGGPRTIGMLRVGERCTGVALGLHRRQAGACVLLSLKMLLGACDRSLRRIVFRGRSLRGTRSMRGDDGLARIAHFLHRGACAAGEAGDTDEYRNDPQHKVNGH